jgi:hypothetical protein
MRTQFQDRIEWNPPLETVGKKGRGIHLIGVVPPGLVYLEKIASMKRSHQQSDRTFTDTERPGQVSHSQTGVTCQQNQDLTVTAEQRPRFFRGWHVRIMYIQ